MNINKIFVLITFLFGVIILFITPPFQQQDEVCHFLRAYSISENYYLPNKTSVGIGCELPVSLNNLWYKYKPLLFDLKIKTSPKQIKADVHQKLDKDNKEFTILRTSMSYSPISYLHYSTILHLAKTFNLAPLLMLYLSRLAGLILYTFIGYFAIKEVPFLKWTTFLILTYPIHICLASSVTVDTILIPCSVLFFAEILKYSFDDNIKILTREHLLILILLSSILALTKYNIILTLFIFLIPKEKFGEKYLFKILGIEFFVVIMTLIWFNCCREMTFQTFDIGNWKEQLNFILLNKIEFIKILSKTIFTKWNYYYMTSIGILGNINIKLPQFVYWSYLILIPLSLIYDNYKSESNTYKPLKQLLIIFAIVLEIFFIFLIMYLTFNAPKNNIINGVNGRYFAVILLPLFVVAAQYIKTKIQPTNFLPVLIPLMTFVVLSTTVITLLNRFYIIF